MTMMKNFLTFEINKCTTLKVLREGNGSNKIRENEGVESKS